MRLIVGCGYLGTRIAQRFQREADGRQVVAVVRTPSEARRLIDRSIPALVADVTSRSSLEALGTQLRGVIETVVYSIGRSAATGLPDQSYESVYIDGLRNVLDMLIDRETMPTVDEEIDDRRRVLLISSTGVCRREDGGWVDETSQTNPSSSAARAMLQAEQLLRRHPMGSRSVILRMAAIYGPGRTPPSELFLARRPIPRYGDRYLNLIHVEDAAAAVVAASTRPLKSLVSPTAGTTFMVADGHPVPLRDYFAYYARLAHLPTPIFPASSCEMLYEPDAPKTTPSGEKTELDDIEPLKLPVRDRMNKRVRNKRLIQDLALKLTYPSYIEGLAAIVSETSGHSTQ